MNKTILGWIGGFVLLTVVALGASALLSSPTAEAAGPGGQPCGGFAGLQCPGANQVCVDDPRDDCDPNRGGADCPGICRGPGGNTQ